MANVRGIFRLNQVYEEQLSGNWAEKSDVFQTQASSFRATHPFGYFAGGDSNAGNTQVSRISYDNDTANCIFRAHCSRTFEHDAAGNETFMYYGGGTYTGVGIAKYNYGNDTENMVPAATLSTTRRGVAAVSNTNYTYFAGGQYDKSSVDRIDNSNDTVTAAPNMTVGRHAFAATGNKNYGYFHGGGPSKSDMERIDYSSETFLTPSIGPTGYPASTHTGFGNADKAYFANGTTVKGFDYSNDTATFATKGPLLFSVDNYPGATGNSSKGYICGKRISPTSNLNRFDYSNDTTTATAAGNLLYNRNYPTAASPQEHGMTGLTLFPPAFRVDWNHGYVGGGLPSTTTILRLDFANDGNKLNPRGPLTNARFQHCGFSSKNHGYFSGGTGVFSSTERVDYSNDTASAAPKGNLSSPRILMQGNATQNYAYISGGQPNGAPNPYTATIDKFDFANDTVVASPTANLGPAPGRAWHSTSGNQNYFWAAGGDFPGKRSIIERFDYSSDTSNATFRSNLSAVRYYQRGCGNKDYGYFGGELAAPKNYVEKLDYANDTTNAVTVGTLATGRFSAGTLANASFGYWIGGGPGPIANMDRVDFSNDTATAVTKDSNAFNKSYTQGVSAEKDALYTIPTTISFPASSPINYGTNKSSYPYGYKMGGYNTNTSRVDRLDFSNDLTNAVTRSSLTQGIQWAMGSASNQDFGYVMGGTNPFTSIVERLDYSNDTQNAAPVGPLSEAAYYGGATGNKDYAWFAYGIGTPSYKTKVERIDYSNDSASGSPKGPTGGTARGWWQGMGNQNYGFFGGGYPSSNSRIEKIDYSNDTAIAVQSGNMPQNQRHMYAAVSNSNYGWFMGGAPGPLSNVDRLDFSNGTSTTVARGNLPRTSGYHQGTGSQNYGYSFGGLAPGATSYINRIDYDNDTVTASPRGYLTQTVSGYGAGAVSSQSMGLSQPVLANVPTTTVATNFGYFGQGTIKKLDRIDYTNDTATALNRIPNFNYSPSGYRNPTAVSSNYAGYWAPGGGSYQYVSPIVKKVDYSNDTTSTNVAPLVNARGYRGGTGNKDFGYFAGGTPWPSSGKSTNVDRIDYSNDTIPGLERGPLLTAMSQCTAVGNQNFGYFRNNYDGPTNRIDYSNDTQTALPKAATGGYYDDAATGNGDFAYIAAIDVFATSAINRFDYSNDTVAGSQRSYLSVTRRWGGATGNKNFGYFAGGYSPNLSSIDRLDYSNDTATASPKGLLSGDQYQHAQSPTSAAESNNPQ